MIIDSPSGGAQPVQPPYGPVLDWPVIHIDLGTDTAGRPRVTVQGEPVEIPADYDLTDKFALHKLGIKRVAEKAIELHRPVRAIATQPDREWRMIVNPDGKADDDPGPQHTPPPPAAREQHARRVPLTLTVGTLGLLLVAGLVFGVVAVARLATEDRALPQPAAPHAPSPASPPPAHPSVGRPPAPSPKLSASTRPSGPPKPAPSPTPSTLPGSGPTIKFPAPNTPRPTATVRTPTPHTPTDAARTPAGPGPHTLAPTTPITITRTVPAPLTSSPTPRIDSDELATQGDLGRVNVTSSHCLVVEPNNTVLARRCDTTVPRWSFEAGRLLYGGRCLTQDGNYTHLATCTGTSIQVWTRATDTSPIRNTATGLCLDVVQLGANDALNLKNVPCPD